jgi:hypothetical protein
LRIPLITCVFSTDDLSSLSSRVDPHGYRLGAFVARDPDTESAQAPTSDNGSELETTGKGCDFKYEAGRAISHIGISEQASLASDGNALDQSIGVAALEFGTVLHRHVLCVTCFYYPS